MRRNFRSMTGRGIVVEVSMRSPSQSAHWETMSSRRSLITRLAARRAGWEARRAFLRLSGASIYYRSPNAVKELRQATGPRPRQQGGLVAPAGPLLEHDDLVRGEELCRALDFEPLLGPNAYRHYGYLAGTDDERLVDLNAAIADPTVDAIWCLRGGYGMTRILDRVDFTPLRKRPRPSSGFPTSPRSSTPHRWRPGSSPSTHRWRGPRSPRSAAGTSIAC